MNDPRPPAPIGDAPDPDTLRRAIAAIETQRSLLGDAVTGLALAPLRQLLAQAEGAAEPAPLQLRRAQVTVLFADIVESTALASRLDAEDVLKIFGGMLQRAAACVRARGGRVLRYTGDGLKAGFGTQGTREDDAAQAVLAGLDILAAGRAHAEAVAREHGVHGFALRVGAHTGEVALGAGFEDDSTLTGDTVNIAARMEQAAPPGALRISAETWAHVRGRFDAQAQPPLAVKGIAAPLQTYLVQRVQAGAPGRGTRGIDGVSTRMVGREAELGALQAAFLRVLGGGQFAAVTVVADAGIGKSRLLEEFDAWTRGHAQRVRHLRGSTTPQTQGQVFGLLRDILARHCQIADDDSLDTARSKLARGIVPLFIDDTGPEQAEGHAHLLGHLIGIDWRDSRHIQGILDDPRQLRSRALHAAAQCFRRLAAREGCPLLLQLQDLHWADAESLDFLNQLAQASHDVPLLVLACTRPALFERATAWGGEGPHQRIDLAPLGPGFSQELAAELLRRLPEVPAALTALLIRQAEGNPFYMEELVKVLIDRGAIQTGERWQVFPDRLQLTRLPTTLTGVLQARLDALPAPEKRALQQASVIGTVFWDQVLAAIDAAAVGHLPALVQRALALPRAEGSLEGLHEYAFHHQLLQQVTYSTVLKQDRRQGHRIVAQWLTGLSQPRAGDFLGTAAEHFERADDITNAVELHARAAAHASARLVHERVLAHVGRALDLLDARPPDEHAAQARLRLRLLRERERTLGLQGQRDAQSHDLTAMAALAEALDDDHLRADVACRRSGCAMRMNDWPASERAARDCMAWAARVGDAALRLEALRLAAVARLQQGDIATSQAMALEGLAEVKSLGLGRLQARMLSVLASVAERQGDYDALFDLQSACVRLNRETGDRVNEAVSLLNVGNARLLVGDLPAARSGLHDALQLLRSNGDRVLESAALGQLSALALWQGDLPAAEALARQALDIALALRARGTREKLIAALRLGDAELAQGRPAAARQNYLQAAAWATESNDPEQHAAAAALARLALAEADPATALDLIEPVLRRAASAAGLPATEFPCRLELTCHEVLAAVGDPRSADWLARAHATLMRRADKLRDAPLRQGFLDHIPDHRKTVAAWSARPQPQRACAA